MAAKKKSARKGKTVKACKALGGRPVRFKGMKTGEVACFGIGKPKSKRAKAKTAAACKAAGGTPVHFKSMAKGEVACFAKGKAKTARKGKAPRSKKQIAAARRNIKKAQAARR